MDFINFKFKKIISFTLINFLFFLIFFPENGISKEESIGKKLFYSPTLGKGTSGKNCTNCHLGGEGISKEFADKKEYNVMGLKMKNLPEVINFCIEVTLRGEGIEPDGQEMRELIKYIKELKGQKK
jgi:cytochrome c